MNLTKKLKPNLSTGRPASNSSMLVSRREALSSPLRGGERGLCVLRR